MSQEIATIETTAISIADEHVPPSVRPEERILSALNRMDAQFAAILPQHISTERFKRAVMMAISLDNDLQHCDHKSLFLACLRAAQDGLMPDKRDGAIVIFNKKVNGQWVKSAQWMPMVYGVIKKIRQSGDISELRARVVYKDDAFDYECGDEEFIRHKPSMIDDAGHVVAAYAIAKFKDGSIEREVMSRAQIEKVRQVSRSKDGGPWVDWFEEQAKKTVLRRLSKRLPMSAELNASFDRDETFAVDRPTLDVSTQSPTQSRQIAAQPPQLAAPPSELTKSKPGRPSSVERERRAAEQSQTAAAVQSESTEQRDSGSESPLNDYSF